MKFIGGSHHGRDVPVALQVAIYSQRRQWIQVEPCAAPREMASAAARPPGAGDDTERYRVVSWRSDDGEPVTWLAREGLGREALGALASGLFAAA